MGSAPRCLPTARGAEREGKAPELRAAGPPRPLPGPGGVTSVWKATEARSGDGCAAALHTRTPSPTLTAPRGPGCEAAERGRRGADTWPPAHGRQCPEGLPCPRPSSRPHGTPRSAGPHPLHPRTCPSGDPQARRGGGAWGGSRHAWVALTPEPGAGLGLPTRSLRDPPGHRLWGAGAGPGVRPCPFTDYVTLTR